MWRNYFPRATIYGLDLYAKRLADSRRLIALQGDQSDPATLQRVVERCPPFDLVIDDGSHIRSHIIASFEGLFPFVKPGGLYAIEDLDAVYPFSHGVTSGTTADTVRMRARLLIDDLTLDRRPVAAVYAYPGLVLVEKGLVSIRVR
jgi:demethylmacrocin O-methyltransferase